MKKLRCIEAKKKSVFSEGDIYSLYKINTHDDKEHGTLTVITSQGRRIVAPFHFGKNKELLTAGCVFRLMLVPTTEE